MSTLRQSHVSVARWKFRPSLGKNRTAAWGVGVTVGVVGTALVSGNNKRDRMKMCPVTAVSFYLNTLWPFPKSILKSSSSNRAQEDLLVFVVLNHCWASLESKIKPIRFHINCSCSCSCSWSCSLKLKHNFKMCLVGWFLPVINRCFSSDSPRKEQSTFSPNVRNPEKKNKVRKSYLNVTSNWKQIIE